MKSLSLYLNFDGNCKETFTYYAQILKTAVSEAMTYAEAPPNSGMPDVGEAYQDLMMHCSISKNEKVALMGSDVAGEFCQQFKPGNNYSISLDVENKKEADRIFAGMSEDGQAVMPLSKTFWGCYWGMCVDKFGIQWMISAPL